MRMRVSAAEAAIWGECGVENFFVCFAFARSIRFTLRILVVARPFECPASGNARHAWRCRGQP